MKGPETLASYTILPEDVADTYPPDAQQYMRYLVTMAAHHDGETCGTAYFRSDGMRHSEDPDAYMAYSSRFYEWQPRSLGGKRGSLPQSVGTVAELHKLGVFPGGTNELFRDGYNYQEGEGLEIGMLGQFDIDNELFEALCLLSNLVWLGGGISNDLRNCNIRKGTIINSPEIVDFMKSVAGDCLTSSIGTSQIPTIQLKTSMTRLLAVMGVPTGNKSTADEVAPRHVVASLITLRDQGSSLELKALAQRILTDVVLTLFGIDKFSELHGRKIMHAGTVPTVSAARARAELFVEVLSSADLGEPEVFGPYRRNGPKSEPRWHYTLKLPEISEEIPDALRAQFFARVRELTTPSAHDVQAPQHMEAAIL